MVGKRKPDGTSGKTNLKKGSGQDRSYANGKPNSRGKGRGVEHKFRQTRGSGQSVQSQDKTRRNFRDRPSTQEQTPPPSTGGVKKIISNIDPFELFCAYHLGIGPNKEYKQSNINEVANRFSVNPAVIHQVSKEYEMDSGSLLDRDFDLALAQLDIQVAPEGIYRTELAKSIYEDFLNAPYRKRDWKKILEDDRKENRKIFGDR